MSNSIREDQIKSYRQRFVEFGDTPEGVFWNDVETQALRFEKLLCNIVPRTTALGSEYSIHEVGCGTGALCSYLNQDGVCSGGLIYSGTEIVEEMVELCKKKFPSSAFFNRDILELKDEVLYDFMTFSGVINLKNDINIQDWQKYSYELISKMFKLSRYGISFNFLTSDITISPNPQLNYVDPRKMLQFCQNNLSRHIILDQSYPLFEVTVTVFKSEFMKMEYNSTRYHKYLP